MNKKQKKLLIGGLLGVVLILGVAYAAFQTQLNINGTSTIASKWDIKILSITPDKTATNSGTAQNPNYTTAGDITHSITNNDLTANFQTALVSPGDSVVYTVVVKNNGTLNAALKTLTKTDSSNPAITFTVEGITENDVINASDTKTFTVTVAYANVENQPAATTSNLSLTLDFTQTNSSSSGTLSPQGGETEPVVINGRTIDQTFVPQYYRYDTSTVRVGNIVDTSSWTQDSTTLTGHDYYMGHDIDSSTGKLTANYVCFVLNNTQHCMKASADGSTWAANKAILGSLNDAGTIECYKFNESEASCRNNDFSDLSAESSGNAYAGTKTSECYALSSGYGYC